MKYKVIIPASIYIYVDAVNEEEAYSKVFKDFFKLEMEYEAKLPDNVNLDMDPNDSKWLVQHGKDY